MTNTEAMRAELLPCPFCGGPSELGEGVGWFGAGCPSFIRPGVMCPGECHALQHRTAEAAIAAWNTRASRSSEDKGVPEGWALVPVEPTAQIIAGAAIAAWPLATLADIALAKKAAPIVLMQADLGPGFTLETLAASIATMAPAYRAMVKAALNHVPDAGKMIATEAGTESAEQWRPISSAPKDGTEILLRKGDRVGAAGWIKWPSSEHEESGEGWTIGHDGDSWDDDQVPTHWMPLPAPPKSGGVA